MAFAHLLILRYLFQAQLRDERRCALKVPVLPGGANSLKVARRGYNFLGEVRCKFLKVAETAIRLEMGCGANF